MFDIFKQDINIGDKVKLYLTTGKEPEGTVLSIGENFVLLQVDDKTQNRFFDKLIGGWDVLYSKINEPKTKIEPQNIGIEKIEIDKSLLIEQVNNFKSSLDKKTIGKFIEANANIIAVRGTSCIASNDGNSNIEFQQSKIADLNLLLAVKSLKNDSKIPIVLNLIEKQDFTIVRAAMLPNTLELYINDFLELIKESKFEEASCILWIIGNEIKRNKYLGEIISTFRTYYFDRKSKRTIQNKEPKIFQVPELSNIDGKKFFKSVEKEINDLIRQSKFDFALKQIDVELLNNSIEEKYKSSLLLKKAQIFSSLSKPDESEKAYAELVLFNEKIKSPANNLSHLYFELESLQSLKPEKKVDAF